MTVWSQLMRLHQTTLMHKSTSNNLIFWFWPRRRQINYHWKVLFMIFPFTVHLHPNSFWVKRYDNFKLAYERLSALQTQSFQETGFMKLMNWIVFWKYFCSEIFLVIKNKRVIVWENCPWLPAFLFIYSYKDYDYYIYIHQGNLIKFSFTHLVTRTRAFCCLFSSLVLKPIKCCSFHSCDA